MDPVHRILLCTDSSSTPPQQAFEHADGLLQEAAALRKDADDLRGQIDLMSGRADALTKTAQGLQEIAVQDREAIQMMWQKVLRTWSDNFTLFTTDASNAVFFKEMELLIEDGMVSMEDVKSFLGDVRDYCADFKRSERSATPEPETPIGLELPIVRTLFRSQSSRFTTLKRKANSMDGQTEAGMDALVKNRKRLRQDQGSDEETLANDSIIRSVYGSYTRSPGSDEEVLATGKESSREEAVEVDDDSDETQVASEAADSSEDSGSESGSSTTS